MCVECRIEYEVRGLGFSITVNLNAKTESSHIVFHIHSWHSSVQMCFAFHLALPTCLTSFRELLVNFLKVKLYI